MSWTDERVEQLKKLWARGAERQPDRRSDWRRDAQCRHREGASARTFGASNDVADEEPPRASPAVWASSGKASRENALPAPSATQPCALSINLTRLPICRRSKRSRFPFAERKTIQMLTESSCRWPIGDPQNPDFHFCNRNKVPGLPYCEVHARRAFQPPQPRRRDREVVEVAGPLDVSIPRKETA